MSARGEFRNESGTGEPAPLFCLAPCLSGSSFIRLRITEDEEFHHRRKDAGLAAEEEQTFLVEAERWAHAAGRDFGNLDSLLHCDPALRSGSEAPRREPDSRECNRCAHREPRCCGW